MSLQIPLPIKLIAPIERLIVLYEERLDEYNRLAESYVQPASIDFEPADDLLLLEHLEKEYLVLKRQWQQLQELMQSLAEIEAAW